MLWPVERLLYAVVTEHHAPVHEPEALTLTDEQRALMCADCGHLRSEHPGGTAWHVWDHCIRTVPSEVGGYWRDPCPCRAFVGCG